MTSVASTEIFTDERLDLAGAAERYLPVQGGIELQRDQPGKVHSWHSHSVHETLVVLDGQLFVEFVEQADAGPVVHSATAGQGVRIELSAKTVHQSTAGSDGCVYFIIPEGGKAAVTISHPAPIGL